MNLSAYASEKSLAILQVIDGFSGEPLDDDSVIFQLGNVSFEPIRKANGFCVFTDLPTSRHRLHISCAAFTDFEIALTTLSIPLVKPLAELIVVRELQPSARYSYPAGTMLVCGQVTSNGKPLEGVEVFALFSDRLGTWQCRKTTTSASVHEGDPCRGQYALALPPSALNASVGLRFTKEGHKPHFDRVAPTRSTTTFVGADLQPAIA